MGIEGGEKDGRGMGRRRGRRRGMVTKSISQPSFF